MLNKELLVDGYNVMWASELLNPVARFNFNAARDIFEEIVADYAKTIPEKIILVFDGYKGTSPYTRRYEKEPVDIIITGKGISADKWIMETISREDFDGEIITSDREIRAFAESVGIISHSALFLEKQLNRHIKENKQLIEKIKSIKKR